MMFLALKTPVLLIVAILLLDVTEVKFHVMITMLVLMIGVILPMVAIM
jgi:hypothetical protein